MIKKILPIILLTPAALSAAEQPDTLSQSFNAAQIQELDEVSVTAIKYAPSLALQPVASTTVGKSTLHFNHIVSAKQASEIAPNFYIPDYGSRITSTVYVRGLGARIDQPAVGLNVDNIPVLNKNDYDFDLIDMERMEVLRGPQSALYGRNTMGGLINIYTLSPLRYQGLRFLGEYSSGQSWRVGMGVYQKFHPNFGFGLSLTGFRSDGFNTNLYTGGHADDEEQYTMRLKLAWQPRANLTVENVASASYNRQGGYPYEWLKTGEISRNDTCYYHRTSVMEGLTVQLRQPGFTLSSITGLRYLDDDMTMDQDFTPLSYFTLQQATREWSLTQDVVLRGTKGNYKWLGGVFGFLKHSKIHAPVNFLQDGIDNLIVNNINAVLPSNLGMTAGWDEASFLLESDFTTPVWGLAAYHQSDLALGAWDLSAALRLDYEHTALFYHSHCATSFSMYRGSIPLMSQPVEISDNDHLKQSFVQLLPKFTATYHLPMHSPSTLYASIAKGYKSGGYNTQMFSDFLQQKLMETASSGKVTAAYDADQAMSYKPEHSWNYEVGGHFSCADGRVYTNLSAFYIDCRDQQLTVFPAGLTTGRIMTNAARTRSTGVEVAITAHPTDRWEFNATYGFTDARFVRYNDGTADYRHNFIPYAPRHTAYASATYVHPIKREWLSALSGSLNVRGVGPIYWDEANEHIQNFYAQLGATVSANIKSLTVDLWGENILNAKYNTFYFVSVGNSFVQHGKPRRWGVTLRYNI
jgi:outer membrane receptor protein involved in Fe transport